MKIKIQNLFIALAIFAGIHHVAAQGTAFTYQGKLASGTNAANGLYDFSFAAYDAASGGTQKGSTISTNAVAVASGYFMVTLDFGNVFPGDARWLDISVKTNGAGSYTALTPRQPLTPSPYAIMAGSASNILGALPAAQLSGSVPDARLSANVPRLNSGPTFTGNVTSVGDLLAARLKIGSGHQLTGAASTIAGGLNNTNQASWSAIGGGEQNTIQPAAYYATLGGGSDNTIQTSAGYTTLGGGAYNTIQTSAGYATLGGGYYNTIQTNASCATLGGGAYNTIQSAAYYATLGGGYYNTIQTNAFGATLGGGYYNTIQPNATYATIPGGRWNSATNYAFAAGYRAKANHQGAFVWADSTDADFASTATNQFLIRATGGVGIGINNPQAALHVAGTVKADAFVSTGTTPASFPSLGIGTASPEDALLDVEGNMRLNNFDLFLREGTDRFHGLGWYGISKLFAGVNVDGPVLYGWSGGGLGSKASGDRLALQWDATGNVGIGTNNPQVALHVVGSERVTGLLRLGSETGTSDAPAYPAGSDGLLIRRISSTTYSSNNIVARTDKLTLIRDGTFSGLNIVFGANAGRQNITATGVDRNGNQVTRKVADNNSLAWTVVFSDAQKVVHYDISFGDTYNPGHTCHVVLDRYDDTTTSDHYLVGTVTSTYNQ